MARQAARDMEAPRDTKKKAVTEQDTRKPTKKSSLSPKSMLGKVTKVFGRGGKHKKALSRAHPQDRPDPERTDLRVNSGAKVTKVRSTDEEKAGEDESPYSIAPAPLPLNREDSGFRDEGERFASIESGIATFGPSAFDGMNLGSFNSNSSLEF